MRKLLMLLLLFFIQSVLFAQNNGTVSGKVIDKESKQPLVGATVTVRGSRASTITSENGTFTLSNVKSGKVTLIISYVGYGEIIETTTVSDNGTSNVNVELSVSFMPGNEVVVTASKRPEKITNAPASISVINAKDFSQLSSFNVGELASKIQGVEFIRTGVTGVGFNARGFNNAFNAKILQITDGRNSMMAGSSGLPSGIMNTVIK